jgi:hypothetical protein
MTRPFGATCAGILYRNGEVCARPPLACDGLRRFGWFVDTRATTGTGFRIGASAVQRFERLGAFGGGLLSDSFQTPTGLLSLGRKPIPPNLTYQQRVLYRDGKKGPQTEDAEVC